MINVLHKSGQTQWVNSNMLSFGSKNPGIFLRGTPKIFADLRVWFFVHILPKLKTELVMLFHKTNKQISDVLKSLVWDTILEKTDLHGTVFSEDYNRYLRPLLEEENEMK